ncbi:MAG TPA: AAA family ATPase [Anaerolineales bacterium]|nr:AAA family ATPase [Anaerolineales bacterium]
MEELSLASLYDGYSHHNNGFRLFRYFTACFSVLPSSVRVILPVQGSKEVIDSILKHIGLERFSFVPVLKNWHTDDSKAANMSDDYAYEYVFKSEQGQMLIHFVSQYQSLQVHFLYSLENAEAEKWILETNHSLRSTYGSEKLPGFKVLVASDSGFYTEDVHTIDFRAIEIDELYNDDFLEIDSIISESLAKQEAGIVLLHGEPGTGKTTYIKHLISKFQDKDFIFIQNDFVKDLLKPSFISFLLNNKNAVLIIEDAEKVVITRESASDDSVVSTILQLTDGLFSDFLNIKIICTFNTTIDRLDKALLRKGRMIAKYRFSALAPEKAAALARKLGHETITGSLTLADIFGLSKPGFEKAAQKAIGFSKQ